MRAFFEGHVDGPAHPAEELDEGVRFGREQRAGDHPACLFAHRGQRGCLMHIEPDILWSPLMSATCSRNLSVRRMSS